MKNFFDELTIRPEEGLELHKEGRIVETQIPCCDGSLFTYIIPRKDGTSWVAACWDDTFDFVEHIDSDDAIEVVKQRWPYFGKLLYRSLHKQYAESALTRITDYMDDKKKWAVITTAEGLGELSRPEDFFAFPQLMTAMERVQHSSVQLYEELKADRPEAWKDRFNLVDVCEQKEDVLFIQFGLTKAE